MTLYESFRRGEPSPLPDLPVQYADFSVWQRRVFEGALQRELSYWRRTLAGAPEILNIAERTRPAVQSGRGATFFHSLSGALTAALAALCHREEVSLFMALTAGFQAWLSWRSGWEDIVIGTDVANRERPETEGLIGFFVNQLVLRTDLSGNPSVREMLRRVRMVTLQAYDHQNLPFDWLVASLNPERSLAQAPLCQVKILLQHAAPPAQEPAGLVLQPLLVEPPAVQLDLLVNISEGDGRLWVAVEYSLDLFSEGSIQQMIEGFARVLDVMTEDPEATLSEIADMLSHARQERRQEAEQALERAIYNKLKTVRRTALRVLQPG